MTTAAAPRIHPTAVVDPSAKIGVGVEIGPYCVIDAGAALGDSVKLGAFVRIHGCVTIGPGTSIRDHSVIGGEPQDTKYKDDPSRVVIGAGCRIHEHVTVHRGTGANTETWLGDGVMLMASSHVGHNCRVERDAVLVNSAMLGGHVHVGERAFISGGAAVHQFCRVGRLTLVGGAAMVTKDAPPFSIVVGSYPLRWRAPNTIGLRRAGLSAEQRSAIRHALARIFRSGQSPTRVAHELSKSPVPEVAEIARFVAESKRGICAGPGGVRHNDEGDEGF
ncbi:MAG: acyl-ACP--UDP-N-acetylglucosamine O-acyltransferase [Planctomycetota bacterium]|nr:acyl-ACP--UDP-N-acetylglucosamine O-acyltransferase [Planctomycetota bacterium]